MAEKHVLAGHMVQATPPSIARRVRGLSDRGVAWLFIGPTMAILLAINIFPLLWAITLSFTNYRANRPNAPIKWIGLEHYSDVAKSAWSTDNKDAIFCVPMASVIHGFIYNKDMFDQVGVKPS